MINNMHQGFVGLGIDIFFICCCFYLFIFIRLFGVFLCLNFVFTLLYRHLNNSHILKLSQELASGVQNPIMQI